MANLPMSVPITATPFQFAKLLEKLPVTPDVEHYQTQSPTSGLVTTSEADFAYAYDGTSTIHITISALHGFIISRLPNTTIAAHIASAVSEYFA